MNIEEIAFKDRKTLANLNAIDLLDIIEFLQNDRKQWINQFIQTHNESVDIRKENLELKEKLDKYENAVADYETTMFEKEQLNSLVNSCQEAIRQLKKQVEDTIKSYTEEHNLRHNSDLKLDVLRTQQQEFINYLEDEKDRLARENSNLYEDSLGHTRLVNEDIFDKINEILQKYKSIIGVSE